jgi:hypothetical protein
MEGVKTCLSSQAADFFDPGIKTYGKCLNSGGDDVEEKLEYRRIFYILSRVGRYA